jgi:hypothetical protein
MTIIKERFKIVKMKEQPRDYDAFTYRIDIKEKSSNTFKHYIGWHAGHIEDVDAQKYWHSSSSVQMEEALETATEIVYNIIDYGTNIEMATLENKLCSEVDATSNPLYYNRNNGGGKHCHSVKGFLGRADTIFANINNGVYAVNHYDKKFLQTLINKGSKIQVRIEEFDVEHVRILRDQMLGKTSDDFDPIHLLMPEKQDDLPITIGGNHSMHAVVKAPTMCGLNAVEIPFSDWSKLEHTELEYLGLRLNPRPKKPIKPNSLDDAAVWIINTIQEKELYKNKSALPISDPEPWYNHSELVAGLSNMNFCATQRGEITKKAKELWARDVRAKSGANFINFSDSSLEENPRLKMWLKNHKNHLMSTRNYDKIVKISAAQHIWSQIEKIVLSVDKNTKMIDERSVPKKVHVLIYFPALRYCEKSSWSLSLSKWDFLNRVAISNFMEVTYEFLPLTSDKIILPELQDDSEIEDLDD